MKKFILVVLVSILSVSLYSQERVNEDLGEIIGTSKLIRGFNQWYKRDGVWKSISYSQRYEGVQMVQIRYKETIDMYIMVFYEDTQKSSVYPYKYLKFKKLALYKIQEKDYINMINLGNNEKITININHPLIVDEYKDIPQIIYKSSNEENFKSKINHSMTFQNYTNKDGVTVGRFSSNIIDFPEIVLSSDFENEYIEYSGSIKDFKLIELNNN